MSFEEFKKKMFGLARKSGVSVTKLTRDEYGRMFGVFEDGTTIIGNASTPSVTVRWGKRNHQAVATL